MKKLKAPGLAWQILIGLALGILLGALLQHYMPNAEYRSAWVKGYISPLGDIFMHLIKMIVVPIVVSSLIVGIAGMGDAKKLGKIGAKTIIYFEIITTIAIAVGLALGNIFKPGVGVDRTKLTAGDMSSIAANAEHLQHQGHGFYNTVLGMIPENIIQSMSATNMLAIIFFTVLFAMALATLPKDGPKEVFLDIMRATADAMFKLTGWVMRYAPIGVFALMTKTVSDNGLSSLIPLFKLVGLVYFAIALFAIVILGGVAKLCGFNIFLLMRILKDELLLAYSTSSSESVLPRIIQKMEQYGAPKAICSFVIPTGYSFNLDGSTLYQSIAALFLAQMAGIDLTITQQITLLVTLMLTSKGIAGVPGVSFVVLMATLPAVGVPTSDIAFIMGVDRLMDMARTALNVVGNALAVLVIAKWEGQYDAYKGEHYFETRAREREERRARRAARQQNEALESADVE
ncbi:MULTISPECIES: glutamate/aspartate:proton symporter GltP [unclassified Zymobacter]|uniref:glutamate/aspartate:proton symporter GltP n=1 Tax=unclassified Zymobacter TaxID=3048685 RepID=UPI0039C1AF63